ncbi:borealin-like [Antedon mediterranea]|uniref:borealin-like n=1 Tax=Antedon mediterranea TaxID=105859 RepID=UPI003AF6AB3D
MPPRKRRTKLTTRPKPKLPQGQGQDDVLDTNERKNKLELLLRDFDLEVNNRLEQMEREAHKMRSMINTLFRLEMCKMNKDILRMTRKEFLAKGGSVNDAALQEVSQYVDSLSEHIVKPLQTSANSDQDGTAAVTAKKKTKQKKAKTSKKKLKTSPQTEENENMMPPPSQSLRRSTRKQPSTLMTPAQQTQRNRGSSNTGWNTPAVTPKFDPRLPVTPGARRARKGERLMSMTGSPVIPAAPAPRTISQDLKDNIIAVNNTIQHIDLDDQVARRNIKLLQDSLAKILHTLPVK